MGAGTTFSLADVDGNGRVDMWLSGPQLRLYRDVAGQLPAPSWSGGQPSTRVAAGDFNGDGFDDALALSGSALITPQVALSDGLGGASIQTLPIFSSFGSIGSTETFDFDGDGFDDVVLSGDQGGAPRLMRGGPTGLSYVGPVSSVGVSYKLAVADFDGDGRDDLASRGSMPLTIYSSLGTGAFTPLTTLPGASAASSVFATADLEGDGDWDLVLWNHSTGALEEWLNGGSANFTLGATSSAPNSLSRITVEDWDRDGTLDALILQDLERMAWMKGQPGGGFGAPRWIDTPLRPIQWKAHDLDSDGDSELILTLTNGQGTGESILVMEGVGQDVLGPIRSWSADPFGPLQFADLNADGLVELVSGGVGTRLGYGLGLAPARFSSLNMLTSVTLDTNVRVADLDGDGAADVFTSVQDRLSIWRGVPGSPPTLHVSTPVFPALIEIALADFDSDGELDLVSLDEGGWLRVQRGDGAFGFTPVWQGPGGWNPRSLATLDFDLDGRLDIANTAPSSNDLLLHRGRGDGTFELVSSAILGWPLGAVRAHDLDRDGRTDLLLNIGSPARLLPLLNTPGGFVNGPMFELSGFGQNLSLADVNADGELDLVDAGIGVVRITAGVGDGSFGPSSTLTIGSSPWSVAAFDFDRDGRLELVVTASSFSSQGPDYIVAVAPHDGRAPARYCASSPGSAACVAQLERPSCARLSSAIPLVASGLPVGRSVVFVYGPARAAIPFLGGTLCVAPPLTRMPLLVAAGAAECEGSVQIDLAAFAASGAAPNWSAGVEQCFQALYRDGDGVLAWSDAVELTFLP